MHIVYLSAKLWNLDPRGKNTEYQGSSEHNYALSIAISKGSNTLVSGGLDKKMHVLGTKTGNLRTSIVGSKQKNPSWPSPEIDLLYCQAC